MLRSTFTFARRYGVPSAVVGSWLTACVVNKVSWLTAGVVNKVSWLKVGPSRAQAAGLPIKTSYASTGDPGKNVVLLYLQQNNLHMNHLLIISSAYTTRSLYY